MSTSRDLGHDFTAEEGTLLTRCEGDFDLDFGDINAEKLADPIARWPLHVATAVKALVRVPPSLGRSLCSESARKRLTLDCVLQTLAELLNLAMSGKGVDNAAVADTTTAATPPASSAAAIGYVASDLSMQVDSMLSAYIRSTLVIASILNSTCGRRVIRARTYHAISAGGQHAARSGPHTCRFGPPNNPA